MDQALALSDAMLAASEADDWTQVHVLDEEFSRCVAHIDVASLPQRAALDRLAANARLLLKRAAEARHAVETQMGQHTHKHRALKAYISTPG